MAECVARFKNVRIQHGAKVVFNNLNFCVPYNKVVAILGGSGVGKTTILQALGGQAPICEGSIEVDGKVLGGLSRHGLYAIRQRMGVLFQHSALFTDLSVFENVAFPLRRHSTLPEELLRPLVLMKLEAVGLRGAAPLYPAQLSGGMARRVALARAIALDPMLMLYDEPFTGLDPISLGVIAGLIRKLNDALGATSIIVSHDVQVIMEICDYVYMVAAGGIVAQGEPEALMLSDAPMVRQFLEGRPDGPVPFHYPAEDYAADLGTPKR